MLARIRKQLEEKDDKGFTLVELLVVIIIIGILAAIAIPLYLQQQNKAKDSAAKADANTLRTAVVSAITEAPTATGVTFASAGEPVIVTISLTGVTAPDTDVALSPGNTLGATSVTLSPPSVSLTVNSPTGASFTIDENGTITEGVVTPAG